MVRAVWTIPTHVAPRAYFPLYIHCNFTDASIDSYGHIVHLLTNLFFFIEFILLPIQWVIGNILSYAIK
jgi:hypothetical protein